MKVKYMSENPPNADGTSIRPYGIAAVLALTKDSRELADLFPMMSVSEFVQLLRFTVKVMGADEPFGEFAKEATFAFLVDVPAATVIELEKAVAQAISDGDALRPVVVAIDSFHRKQRQSKLYYSLAAAALERFDNLFDKTSGNILGCEPIPKKDF